MKSYTQAENHSIIDLAFVSSPFMASFYHSICVVPKGSSGVQHIQNCVVLHMAEADFDLACKLFRLY